MAESEPFTIGARAECTDGPCGHLTQVVVDPIHEQVTHLIVEPEHRSGLGRLVPVERVDATPDAVRIRASKSELEDFETAEETRFLPGTEGYGVYNPEEVMWWPFFGGNTTPPVTVDTLPVGEVAVRRGEDVHATDGKIGAVDGLIVDHRNHHVTHLVLAEGHLFGRKDVSIPIGAVERIDDEGIRISMTRKEIEDLPPVEFTRP